MPLRKRLARITGTTPKEVAGRVRHAKKLRASGETKKAYNKVYEAALGGPRAGARKSPKRAERIATQFVSRGSSSGGKGRGRKKA